MSPIFTPAYLAVLTLAAPIIRRWGRLRVTGESLVPQTGPLIIVGNHDSYWDPIAIAVAARRRRQIHALAKSTLWRFEPIGRLMDGMGHIPVHRGRSDVAAMQAAVQALEAGACVGIFPEGTRSLGRELRARSGVGRLVLAVPSAKVICVRVSGTVDIVRIPVRPSLRVEFFEPAGPRVGPNETVSEVAARLLTEIRRDAPQVVPGRRRPGARYRRTQGTRAY